MKELRNIVLRSQYTGLIYICTPEFGFAKRWNKLSGSWNSTCIKKETLKCMQRIGQNYGVNSEQRRTRKN